ncbi:hypothetical protein ABIA54_005040 [Pseudomonas sp. EB276 TE3739]|uniref:hypothetical protein n=1 Tax=Pseudomonas TaxID=286 RepID=UPI0020A21E9A|nr:hypothetical protein [Pseudomonas koreensis]MCP1476113.1 hypothetical protein [Pseudomonas koreensis]
MKNSKAVHDFTDFSNGNANGWRDMNGGGNIVGDPPYYSTVFSEAGTGAGPVAIATIDKVYPTAFNQTKVDVEFRIRLPLDFEVERFRLYADHQLVITFALPASDNEWHVVKGEWTPPSNTVTRLTLLVEGHKEGVGLHVDFDSILIRQD